MHHLQSSSFTKHSTLLSSPSSSSGIDTNVHSTSTLKNPPSKIIDSRLALFLTPIITSPTQGLITKVATANQHTCIIHVNSGSHVEHFCIQTFASIYRCTAYFTFNYRCTHAYIQTMANAYSRAECICIFVCARENARKLTRLSTN